MWTFPMVFWLMVIAFLVLGRRRRWRSLERRWERHAELRSQREDEVQLLEVRLARLEERLEFTEKLLMERPAKPD